MFTLWWGSVMDYCTAVEKQSRATSVNDFESHKSTTE